MDHLPPYESGELVFRDPRCFRSGIRHNVALGVEWFVAFDSISHSYPLGTLEEAREWLNPSEDFLQCRRACKGCTFPACDCLSKRS